jgi:hypothetical protein
MQHGDKTAFEITIPDTVSIDPGLLAAAKTKGAPDFGTQGQQVYAKLTQTSEDGTPLDLEKAYGAADVWKKIRAWAKDNPGKAIQVPEIVIELKDPAQADVLKTLEMSDMTNIAIVMKLAAAAGVEEAEVVRGLSSTFRDQVAKYKISRR